MEYFVHFFHFVNLVNLCMMIVDDKYFQCNNTMHSLPATRNVNNLKLIIQYSITVNECLIKHGITPPYHPCVLIS